VIETQDEGDTGIHGEYRPRVSHIVADEEGQKDQSVSNLAQSDQCHYIVRTNIKSPPINSTPTFSLYQYTDISIVLMPKAIPEPKKPRKQTPKVPKAKLLWRDVVSHYIYLVQETSLSGRMNWTCPFLHDFHARLA
jgi:hypothetical protein